MSKSMKYLIMGMIIGSILTLLFFEINLKTRCFEEGAGLHGPNTFDYACVGELFLTNQ